MSFALCLYHVRDANESVEFPHLLLFDEIDAPLHPSMTRSLLRTIEQTLVNERQIKVILTTHSPSTVALAPNASIFVMQKHVVERLQKSSKDSALGILTAGVPTLSVNYENRRQVFVESKFDVKYYSALYLLAKGYLHPDISLTFIASGVGGMGNCDQVKSVVTQLREGGNCTAMGVVDWDKKNTSQAGVFAMGENERYSIDNFILDPTLLGFLLLREKFASPADFGLKPDTKYMDIGSFGQLQLQSVANYLVGKISPSSSGTEGDELVEFRYLREVAVTVPKWFAHMQGHDLEQRAKEAFPQLLRYRDEPDLKLAIIEKVLDDLPMFVPSSFATMFRKLQDHT